MEKKIKKCSSTGIIFIGILILHLACWLFYSGNTTITGDEFFSYGLSNGTEDYIFWDMNQIEAHSNEGGWIEGQAIQSYLQVDEGEQFSYDRVWWNQEHDVHPPLYYTILNTVSSMFQGQYSKWFGIGISIFFLMMTEIVIYRISVFYLGKKILACLPGLLWGFAAGTFFLGSLVRMYAMLGFFCMLLVWQHTKLIYYGFRKRDYILLGLTITAGGLTHYYFYLFLALFGGLYFILLLLRKESVKRVICYCATVAAGGILAILIFPGMLNHIFGGYRGDDVKSMLLSLQFNLTGFLGLMNEDLFNGHGMLIMFIIGAGSLVCFICERNHISISNQISISNPIGLSSYIGLKDSVKRQLWLLSLLVGICYALAMMKMSISVRTAYISPCYAVLLTILYIGMIRSCRILKERRELVILSIGALVFIVLTVPGILKEQKAGYQTETQYATEFRKYQDTDCIFVYDSWNNLFDNRMDLLADEDEICCLDAANIESDAFTDNLEKRRTKDQVIIMLPENEETENRISLIEKRLDCTAKRVITGGNAVYLIDEK